ncbi:hypothetical protein CYMTET_42694 [Cymbomonas tetramitiformis]|uniref:Reverse transcriptase domain-containing protein n=1 Tax=Cymbomonas tetramitiformis TaxID=36881 RepID=A0AAE0C4X8_9CHLO|nr:hypothetical protein CYMTET_42694 [Cymbomonas tetramitiformis]
MMKKLKKQLRKSPEAACKLLEQNQRFATRRSATSPALHGQRRAGLSSMIRDRLQEGMQEGDGSGDARTQMLCSAWRELSPAEKLHAASSEYGPRAVKQHPRAWQALGIRRLRKRRKAAALVIQRQLVLEMPWMETEGEMSPTPEMEIQCSQYRAQQQAESRGMNSETVAAIERAEQANAAAEVHSAVPESRSPGDTPPSDADSPVASPSRPSRSGRKRSRPPRSVRVAESRRMQELCLQAYGGHQHREESCCDAPVEASHTRPPLAPAPEVCSDTPGHLYARSQQRPVAPANVTEGVHGPTQGITLIDTISQQGNARSQQRQEAPARVIEETWTPEGRRRVIMQHPLSFPASSDDSLNFTQRMARAGSRQISPTCLTSEEMTDVLNIAAVRAVRWSPKSARPISEETLVTGSNATDGDATSNSAGNSNSTHVSATDIATTGTTHVSVTDSDATSDSAWDSDPTHVSATDTAATSTTHVSVTDGGDATSNSVGDSDSILVSITDTAATSTTHISATDDDAIGDSAGDSDSAHISATDADASTTHVSATDGDATSDATIDSGAIHVSDTDVDSEDTPVSAADHAAGRQGVHVASVCALKSHALPEDRHCKHIRKDGTIKWRYAARSRLASTLAAVRDEDGPLLLVFYAYLRGHMIKVLVDSGASDNFVSEECAKRCNLTIRKGAPMQVTLADGSVKTTGEVAHSKFKAHTAKGVDYCENNMMLRVLPLGIQGAGLIEEVFLTAAQLKKHLVHAETRRQAEDMEAQPQWLIMAEAAKDGSQGVFAAVASDLPGEEKVADEASVKPPDPDTRDAKISPTWRQRFQDFFTKYSETLRKALPEASKLRRTTEDMARITRKADAEGGPSYRRPYRMSVEELRQLRERVEQLMEKGYIRPSCSPYAAPCLMVPKPGDPKTLRLVVDYRQLNQQTVRDRYPLPDIQLMFDEMQGATFFSSFDAVDGFWQVPMAEEDVEKTAFTTQMGAYEWLVMPQGLQNSPSQYQRRMQRALGHLPFVRIFIDDVVVFTKGNDIEAHYNHVKQFLDTCQEAGVYLKDSKAQMCKESLRFLGHTLSAKGCQPQHDKVAAIKDWPRLETVTQVRQFLGLAGYYRRFVHCFSEIAQPLTSLTKTDVPWEWGEQQQWAFEELKTALSSAPTPRDGLKEAGVVDVKTDLPKDPLSVLDAKDLFEDSPPAARPQWLAAIEAWVDGDEPDPTLAADVAVRRSARLQEQPEVSTARPEPRASHHPEDARSQLRQEAPALVKRGPGRPPKHPAQQQEAPALKTQQQEARSQLRQEAPTLKLQQSADRQGWKVRNEVYQRLQTLYGKFDIDVNWGTMDDSDTQWRGKHVWCTPPYSSSDTAVVEAMLQKYVQEWRADPSSTSAVFLLPDIQNRLP